MDVDLYDILNIDPDASPAEIKSAYRRLALRYHPDQNPGDRKAEERFKEVTHAYQVLSDPQKRRAYDRLQRGRSPGGRRRSFENLGDFFETLNSVITAGFSELGKAASGRKGDDIHVDLTVTLEEAMTGVRRDVEVKRPRRCDRCGGRGAEPGTALDECAECGGRGKVRKEQGFFSLMRDCKVCLGRGQVIETHCRRCQGEGVVEGTELLPVDVPPGVRDGQTLRWSKKGRRGKAERGDLLIEIRVQPHELFSRDEQDIYLTFPVSFDEASLGAKVEVPTLDGSVMMKVPPGTRSGRVFRLQGKGLPAIGNRPRGDQYVRLTVKSPEDIDGRQPGHRNPFEARERDRATGGEGLWERMRSMFDRF